MKNNDISRFVEPVFHFCLKRLSNRTDAEDLAGEILLVALEGLERYNVQNLDAWVWRIAHNRYARFIYRRKLEPEMVHDTCEWLEDENDFTEAIIATDEYEPVFRSLHTLSAEYRNILVDYYIGEMSVKKLAEKYALNESTVKWRLNTAREKIRKRIGDENMERIYKRINWDTTTCNGSMDSDEYLHSQIARAICEAAYEKPLTVEEISLKTGIPALYIEDELPKLIYGDAITRVGNKYATDFIVLHLNERPKIGESHLCIVGKLADCVEKIITEKADCIREIGFCGSDRDIKKLGYIISHIALRDKFWKLKRQISDLHIPPYPPRKDGGYGWFIVDELPGQEYEGKYMITPFENGDNCAVEENNTGTIHYCWLGKYFERGIYDGTRKITEKNIICGDMNVIVKTDSLTEDEIIALLSMNLIRKDGDGYAYNFPLFTPKEFERFRELAEIKDEHLIAALSEIICEILGKIRDTMYSVVPKRLESQIDMRISIYMNDYLNNIIGCVIEELIICGVLEKPDENIPMTNGVFYVAGEYNNI